MSTLPKHVFTPEEYLEMESKAEYRSEYCRGEVYAVAGGTLAHNDITTAILRDLAQQLRHKNCRVYGSDLRVAVDPVDLYTYPDVTVCCGGPQLLEGRKDTIVNPTLIVEVLSPSTAAYDPGLKFGRYVKLPTLREYLTVSSMGVDVELRTRQSDDAWSFTYADTLEGAIELASIQCRLLLADIYENVDFTAA
jgi:Uma2 family endonuclease